MKTFQIFLVFAVGSRPSVALFSTLVICHSLWLIADFPSGLPLKPFKSLLLFFCAAEERRVLMSGLRGWRWFIIEQIALRSSLSSCCLIRCDNWSKSSSNPFQQPVGHQRAPRFGETRKEFHYWRKTISSSSEIPKPTSMTAEGRKKWKFIQFLCLL